VNPLFGCDGGRWTRLSEAHTREARAVYHTRVYGA